MRALIALTSLVMTLALLAFSMNNLGTRVPVTLLSTTSEHSLWKVVLVSVVIGVCATAIIAIAEGARTRFENRRLRREVHKLETELNFLRTQPSLRSAESSVPASSRTTVGVDTGSAGSAPPSAPVYDPDADDADDDMYTGGRAV